MWSRRLRRAALDPAGRLRVPRPSTLLRAAAVAVLLLLAALAWRSMADHPAHPGPGAPDGQPEGGQTLDHTGPAGTPAAAQTPAPDAVVSPRGAAPDGAAPLRLAVPPGTVGVPVTVGSPGAAALLRPGDRVDLLTTPVDGRPVTVARDATVLEVAAHDATVLLALTPAEAEQVVAAAGARFAVVIRPEPTTGAPHRR